MINLLPTLQKEELKMKEKAVFVLDIGISILASLISFLLLLCGIYFYLLGEFKDYQITFQTKLQSFNLEGEKELLEKNKFLSKILTFEKEKKEIFPILAKIFEILPEGIKLESLSISKDKNEFSVSLSGLAQDREKLILLRDILQQNFSEVSFPTTVWLKEKDIEFSVSFKTK